MDARIARHHLVSERTLRGLAAGWSQRVRGRVWISWIVGLALLAQASALGCTRDRLVYATALPSTSTPASVEWIAERAGYLDVKVSTAGKELRFFLPASDDAGDGCTVFRGGVAAHAARYVNTGLLGRLDVGEHRCEPVGLLSLEEWRDRRPRGSREPVPRSRATWSTLHRDADVTLLRGRFGLAGELGWVGGADTVAIVGRSALCDAVAESGHASLEFRHVGPDVLTLLGEDGRCRLLGVARPLP